MPTEGLLSDALSQILDHIAEPSDILNVALSSKLLYSIAVPQHLHYRDIRTRLQNPALWTWLARVDDLRAAHIRSLTILPDQDSDFYHVNHSYDLRERLPPDFTPNQSIPLAAYRSTDDCRMMETSMVGTLKRMTRLERVRWYRLPRPLLQETDEFSIWNVPHLGTVKEIDIYNEEEPDIGEGLASAIVLSERVSHFSSLSRNLTALSIRTSACAINDPTIPYGLHIMLLNNLPDLEVLALKLDLHEVIDGTAIIDNIFNSAQWDKLRVLRLRGANCRVAPLIRFLATHSSLEELALAIMTPGRLWTKLKAELPGCNLRCLSCTSSQATALLQHIPPYPGLEMITNIELHDRVVEHQYFTWDEEWEDGSYDDEYREEEIDSPWKGELLNGLRDQHSLKHVGLALCDSVKEIVDLSTVAHTIKEIRVNTYKRPWTTEQISQLYKAYSLFPFLEIIHGGTRIWFDPWQEIQPTEIVASVDIQIQELAHACPKLRVVLVGIHAKKAIIVRDNAKKGDRPGAVKWVVRRWEDNEDAAIKDGEYVYGL